MVFFLGGLANQIKLDNHNKNESGILNEDGRDSTERPECLGDTSVEAKHVTLGLCVITAGVNDVRTGEGRPAAPDPDPADLERPAASPLPSRRLLASSRSVETSWT